MEFCPKGPVGITLHSVGKRMGCSDPASMGGLAPKARETETGNLVSQPQGYSPPHPVFNLPVFRDLSVSASYLL